MRALILTSLSALVLAVKPLCAAGDIGKVTVVYNKCGKVTLSVELDYGWQPMGANNKPTYLVSQYVGGTQSPLSLVKTSNDALIPIDWPPSQLFHFVVDARSRQSGLVGITKYRKVGEINGTTDICINFPLPGEVRLKHEQTGRCMFGNFTPGGPVAVWTCWKDPNMGYFLDALSGNEFQIRHRNTNQCLYVDTPNGGVVKNWPCGVDPKMVWIKDPLPGTNRYRIRNKATGRCIYARDHDAAPVQAWGPCWDDPAMVWIIEPF